MAVACPNMSIVVIVPYHNESKSIERTLDSIDSQTMKPDSVNCLKIFIQGKCHQAVQLI